MKYMALVMFSLFILEFMTFRVHAQTGNRVRVVVERFRGDRANKIRQYVIKAINKQKGNVKLVQSKDVVDVLSRLGTVLDSEESYMVLSRELHINAFIDGEVVREENGWMVSIWVRQGDGKFIAQHSWKNRRFRKLLQIRTSLWKELGDAILGSQAAPEVVSESESEELDSQDFQTREPIEKELASIPPDKEKRPKDEKPSALSADLSFGANWRNNSYQPDDVEQPFRYFNEFFSATPWLKLDAKWFPGAHFSQDWVAHLGLKLGFGLGIGTSSSYEDSESGDAKEPNTLSYILQGGLLGRIPFQTVELGIMILYGRRVFKVSEFPGLPDVSHSYVKIGVMAEVLLSASFGIEGEISYLLRLDTGELSSDSYFPELSGGGVDGGVAAFYMITEELSIRGQLSIQYFFFDLGRSDTFIDLTHGDDSYYTFTLGLGYEL